MTMAEHGVCFALAVTASAKRSGPRDRLRAGLVASWYRAAMSCFSDIALFELVRAYSALKHPRLISFPSHLPFLQLHDFVLSSILLNPHLSQYPPSHTYQLSFWKWVIEHLEILLGDEAGALLSFTTL
jgi:hypothetical protein